MPTLRVQPPDRAPFDVELRGELFRIGRSAQNDLAIPTLSLSRNHAQLSPQRRRVADRRQRQPQRHLRQPAGR